MIQYPLRSLRVQILLGMAASILFMFVFCTLSLHFVLRHHIYEQFFAELHDRARTLSKYVEYSEEKLSFEWAHYDQRSTMSANTRDGLGCLFKVWNAPGKVLAQVNIFDDFELMPGYGNDAMPGDLPHFKRLVLPDGSEAYEVSFRFDPVREDQLPVPSPPPAMGITVVRRTTSVDQTMWRTDTTLLCATTATMLISLVGMWLLIHWGLKPLEPVLVQLKAIGAGDLSQRVDPGKLPYELVSLIRTVNDLLAALEIKVARERRFVSNAAHELRNPITAVRANLEVGLLNSDNPQVREEVGRSCLDAAIHLQMMCERLLSLAGLQQDNIALELQAVDVGELVESIEEGMEVSDEGEDEAVHFQWQSCRGQMVQTDPVLLTVILSNLMRNAAAYGKQGEPVFLDCQSDATHLSIRVSNVIGQDQPLDLEQVMEPFWRGEESRTLGQGHLGLGLAIAQSAAEQLHGSLTCVVKPVGKPADKPVDGVASADADSANAQRVFIATLILPRQWPNGNGVDVGR